MANPNPPAKSGSRWFVLALGLLIGLVIGFVMLLARLPVDSSVGSASSGFLDTELAGVNQYEFYNFLENQKVSQTSAVIQLPVADQSAFITPATRAVPGNAQTLASSPRQVDGYAEIPASSSGQDTFFLQAGSYRNPDRANETRARLILMGFNPIIVNRKDSDGVTGYRVRLGPYVDDSRVRATKQELQRNGVSYEVIRVSQ